MAVVVKYFMYLTDPAMLKGESVGDSLHGRIGVTLAREVIAGGAGELRPLCRLFEYLNIPRSDQLSIKALRALGSQLEEAVADKVAKKMVTKFVESLSALDDTPDEPLDEDTTTALRDATNEYVSQRTAINASARKTPKKPKRRLGRKAAVPYPQDSDDEKYDTPVNQIMILICTVRQKILQQMLLRHHSLPPRR